MNIADISVLEKSLIQAAVQKSYKIKKTKLSPHKAGDPTVKYEIIERRKKL